jgi:RNA-directed DNA polymerase
MGKGVAMLRSSQKKHRPERKLWDKTVQISLWGIANRAEKEPKCVFRNLSSLLTKDHLRECFFQLKKKAAPGVDGVSYASYKENLEAK